MSKGMRVLFVCYGNAYRSPLAEALLKKIRPDLYVESAGIRVSIPISRTIKDFLKTNEALQYLKKTPESLDHKDLKNYNLIVTMQNIQTNAVLQKCPECKNKIIEWNIKDPYFLDSNNAKIIFNEINKKVKELANSI
jgi:protein-tyrosine-phosphatase